MKRLLLAVMACLLISAPAFSLIKVDGAVSGYAKGPVGTGIGIEFPLIPLLSTTLYYHTLGSQKVELPGFTYDGKTHTAGDLKMKAYALELQLEYGIPLTDFAVGGTVLGDVYTSEIAGSDVAMPGSIYTGLYGRYRKALLPFVDMYGTLGLLFKAVDGEKEINDESSVDLDLSDIDRSGLYYRVGLTLGF